MSTSKTDEPVLADPSPFDSETSVPPDTLPRRQMLALIGAGALLAASKVQPVGAQATPTNTPTPCPQPSCGGQGPTVPDEPNLEGFPQLAALARVLTQLDPTGQENRVKFNQCPDKYLDTYFNLTDPEVAQLLSFDPYRVFGFVDQYLPGGNLEKYKWAIKVQQGWEGWKKINPPDCYYDYFPCKPEQAYSYPATRIYNPVEAKPLSDSNYQLTVNGQGFVNRIEAEVVDQADPANPVSIGRVTPLPNSTFRCGRLQFQATLQGGHQYFVRLKIAGYPLTSSLFAV